VASADSLELPKIIAKQYLKLNLSLFAVSAKAKLHKNEMGSDLHALAACPRGKYSILSEKGDFGEP
jgi:hypothetical protein